MADNVTIPTTGTGDATPVIATDQRTIDSVSVHVQRVDEQGGTAIASAQVNMSSTAATLIAARSSRKNVVIVNNQLATVFIGPATVTTANGFALLPGASVTLYTTALIQGITAAASGATEYTHTFENYDTA